MTGGATAIKWLFFLIAFVLFVWYAKDKYNGYVEDSKKASIEIEKAKLTSPPATAVVQEKPQNECATPCTIKIRRNQTIWTDEQSVQFRKKGESEWTILVGGGNVKIPTGDIEFVAYPDAKKQVLVEVANSYK